MSIIDNIIIIGRLIPSYLLYQIAPTIVQIQGLTFYPKTGALAGI